MTANLKRLWKKESVQTLIILGIIALIVLAFWFGSQLALNTQYPVLAVVSGSMCIPYDGACDGWLSVTHPFDRTLHKGDLIIVQGVNPADLNANYPNSDIIIFKDPRNSIDPELIVHRIVSKQEIDGKLYFRTKGDGNSNKKWPTPASQLANIDYDPWSIPPAPGVSEDHIVGKVILRLPFLGHLVLLMRNTAGIVVVIAIVAILIILEFIIPIFKKKKPPASTEPKKTNTSLAIDVFIKITPS